MTNSLPFFVYGTLRPGEHNHDLFLLGRTESEVAARLPGAVLYDGPGYPYAVDEPGGLVHGEVITARPQEYGWLLAALDRLEDYAPGDPANLYERVARKVTCADGTVVQAWVYMAAPVVAARSRARGKLIEGGDWRARR
ncbi:gamma-glutamylcyclotransferase family protein [Streptomyces cavernae]|uniref:gamma-glutamylcyclotransferase family protein n=1 Tax=Streptomyces cavernae TaxID=2259034 RepID=UPI000FEB6CFB|nr:gamma-glutamylcyclotransferase family protein [Streptomyces cavernae]